MSDLYDKLKTDALPIFDFSGNHRPLFYPHIYSGFFFSTALFLLAVAAFNLRRTLKSQNSRSLSNLSRLVFAAVSIAVGFYILSYGDLNSGAEDILQGMASFFLFIAAVLVWRLSAVLAGAAHSAPPATMEKELGRSNYSSPEIQVGRDPAESRKDLEMKIERLNKELEKIKLQSDEKLKEAVRELAESHAELDRYSRQLQNANQQLSRIDAMKSNFISAASHELRTPLTSIKGYVETILHGEVGVISEKQREFLFHVKQSTDRLHRLLKDLLDISRIESGQVRMNKESLDLVAVLEAAVHECRAIASKKSVALDLKIEDKIGKMDCDEEKISEAFRYLIRNAVDCTPPNGNVTISAAVLSGGVQICVSDQGKALKAGDQEKIFEPFQFMNYRGFGDEREEENTGLALMLVKRITEAHGGDVKAESRENAGVTFSIYLPFTASHNERHTIQSAAGRCQ